MDCLPWSIREKVMARQISKLGMKRKPNKSFKSFGGWAQFKHTFEIEVQKSRATLKVGDALPVINLTNLKTGEEQGYVLPRFQL